MLAILQRVENDPISESIRARNADAAERLGASFGAFREDDVAFLKSVRARIADGLDASFDRVLVLEPRALLYPSGLDLERELDALFGDETSVLCAADCAGEYQRWNPGRPNAAQLYLKRTADAVAFLDALIDVAERRRPTRLRVQNALWSLSAPTRRTVEVVRDYWLFAARRGRLIRNFYNAPDAEVERELAAIFGETKGEENDGTDFVGRGSLVGGVDGTPLDGTANEGAPSGGANDVEDARSVEPLAADGGNAGSDGSGDAGAVPGEDEGDSGRGVIAESEPVEAEEESPEPVKKKRTTRRKRKDDGE